MKTTLLTLTAALTLAACAAGPAPQRPAVTEPTRPY